MAEGEESTMPWLLVSIIFALIAVVVALTLGPTITRWIFMALQLVQMIQGTMQAHVIEAV